MIQHYNGKWAEYVVASHFLAHGVPVYWPAMEQSRHDLVIFRDEIFFTVQVKKATWSRAGKREYLQTRLISRNKYRTPYQLGDFDFLMVVDDDRRLWEYHYSEVAGKTSLSLDKRGAKETH